MEDVHIRHAEATDYESVMSVVDEWWGGRKMTDMLPRLFFVHFRQTSFVAEHNGRLVGFLVGFVSQALPNEAYIHFIGVAPDFRRNGLGRLLHKRFCVAAASLGCQIVRCVTSPINEGSIAFHLRMGFSIEQSDTVVDGVAVTEHYDGTSNDRVLLFKVL